jgi:hypothetical protein
MRDCSVPKLAVIMPASPPGDSPLRGAFDRVQSEIGKRAAARKAPAKTAAKKAAKVRAATGTAAAQ